MYYNFTSQLIGGMLSKLLARISEMRTKATEALSDVPDNLIGFLIFLTILTVLGLGVLFYLGFLLIR